MNKLTELPQDLPIPVDDGARDRLLGISLPSIALPSTHSESVDLSAIAGRVVVYCYPMTGQPGIPLPDGWDTIPGARGCTPQSCAFRDHYQELNELGVSVFGLSTQSTDYQLEAKTRLHLPFELLSDRELKLANAIKLPIFEAEGKTLIKRITLIVEAGKIIKVFYPVFPPDRNADDVIDWLRTEGKSGSGNEYIDCPPEYVTNPNCLEVLNELISREPIFHHPEFGTTQEDFENMTDLAFWEVGASGRRYNREYTLAEVVKRYENPQYRGIHSLPESAWETKDFYCREMASNTYLLTYTLVQEDRVTRRATLWQRICNDWKILYHQGTIVEES